LVVVVRNKANDEVLQGTPVVDEWYGSGFGNANPYFQSFAVHRWHDSDRH
jgi:hypothetical protein